MEISIKVSNIKNILLIRADGIGDALNSTPTISALRKTYPSAKISIIIKQFGADILSQNPDIDEILIYNPSKLHKSLINKVRFFSELRSKNFDTAIVLQNSSLCNFMAFVSGANIRVGRRSEPKRFSRTLTHWISLKDPKGTKHEIDRNFDLVRLINVENGSRDLVLRLSDSEKAFADDFLLRNHGSSDFRVEKSLKIPLNPPFPKGEYDMGVPFSEGEYDMGFPFSEGESEVPLASSHPLFHLVGIHPGGSSVDKLWLPENFAEIADRLIDEFKAKIMLFYGHNEDHLAKIILSKMKNKPILISGVSLRQLCAFIERCSFFICNDSGPMHIASAFKIPTVAIFGSTDYVRWGPQHEKALVVRKEMDCFPCSAHKCKKNYECTKSLPISDVWNAILGLI
ncbi:MAG: glycosyltransferase family 9 protein [Candidatus Poribacteria bacterium]